MMVKSGLLYTQVTVVTPERRLAGACRVDSVAASKRYVVYNRWTLQYVCSGKTASDGTWSRDGLPVAYTGEDYFVVYLDDTRSFNPIAFDNITLVE